MKYDTTNPDSKLLPHSIYDILTQISNDFQRSLCRVQCRQTLAAAAQRPVYTQCKPSFVFYPPSLSFCRRSANVRHVHWALSLLCIMSRHAPYCWLATSLFWYSARLSFLKRFWKNTYPTFNKSIFCNWQPFKSSGVFWRKSSIAKFCFRGLLKE